DGEWLGFGCGAHSTRGGVRWKNIASTSEYIDAVQSGQSTMVDVRRMSQDEQAGDALFTGLRLADGVDIDSLEKRYGFDFWARYGDDLARFLEAGHLRRDGSCLRLTRDGMLLAHEVMMVFV